MLSHIRRCNEFSNDSSLLMTYSYIIMILRPKVLAAISHFTAEEIWNPKVNKKGHGYIIFKYKYGILMKWIKNLF